MKLILSIVLARLKRQKIRLLFILLAITASACLIVWTIGGYHALFSEAMREEADYMGVYDLKITMNSGQNSMQRGGGGNFPGPFSRRSTASTPSSGKKKDGTPVNSKNANGSNTNPRGQRPGDSDGNTPGKRSGGRSTTGRGTTSELPRPFIDQIRNDPGVILCDETASVRAFVYYPGMRSALASPPLNTEIANDNDNAVVPPGIDPKLHQEGLATYRAMMGTPRSFGSTFTATSSQSPPYNLDSGKWLRQTATDHDAVLTSGGAEQMKLKPGDSLLLMTPTAEFQLNVVGIVEDKTSEGFYISMPLAKLITGKDPVINSVSLKLRVSVEDFRKQWEPLLQKVSPTARFLTGKDLADQKQAQANQQTNMFRYQAISGTLLAVMAAIFIIFTVLNMSVHEQKRQLALYRTIGLTRGQLCLSILLEALILALPGWLGGVISGWFLLGLSTGKVITINTQMAGFSFICAVGGAVVAAFYPMIQSARVKPLDALTSSDSPLPFPRSGRLNPFTFGITTLLGLLFLFGDIFLVHILPMETEKKALLHSGIGMLLLVLGVLCLIPALIRLTERLFVPILAFLFRFDRSLLRSELSGNMGRTTAVTIVLSIGGGLFVSMQIWGYSMLGPFLPDHGMPERFVSFLPVGLRSELIDELKQTPGILPDRFLPIAVEQAAFAPDSVPTKGGMGDQFANVVLFGAHVEKAFAGTSPMVGMQYIQGTRNDALKAMKYRRGVVITDSISVDYHLNLGDTLRLTHPRKPTVILEYPIVGVVSFPGWQWLSKTGGVRRNFGRSGGIVFANENDIRHDYQIDRYCGFWFDTDGSRSYTAMEQDLDRLAQKNLKTDAGPKQKEETGQTAYVKLSTRDSLYHSISSRADSVIWGLSKMPLMTFAIASIAISGAIANSVRSRRRWFGIMRAIGMTRGSIIRMILVEAILTGLVAVCASFLFGFLAAQGALKLGTSMFGTVNPPLIIPASGLTVGLLLAMGLSLLAAIHPAISTGFRSPLDLLK